MWRQLERQIDLACGLTSSHDSTREVSTSVDTECTLLHFPDIFHTSRVHENGGSLKVVVSGKEEFQDIEASYVLKGINS